MKEENTDPIRELFREGLKNLHVEPDAAVWEGIQHGYRNRRKRLLFWFFSACIALTITAGGIALFQDHTPKGAVAENQVTTLPSGSPEENKTVAPSAGSASSSSADEPSSLSPSSANSSTDAQENPVSTPAPNKGLPEERVSQERSLSPVGKTTLPPAADPVNDHTAPPATPIMPPVQPVPPREELSTSVFMASLFIPGKTFSFENPALNPAAMAKLPEDTSSKKAPKAFYLSAALGTTSPAVYLSSARTNPDFAKTNTGNRLGFSGALALQYNPNPWLGISGGFEYNSYRTNSTISTWGYYDSVEYITESRATGFVKKFDSLNTSFEQTFTWINLPLDLNLHTRLAGPVFGEFSLGMGFNWLIKNSGHKGIEGHFTSAQFEDGLRSLQLSMRVGAGLGYQTKGNWAYFATFQYNALTRPLYDPQYFTEKHHFYTLRFGVRYCLKTVKP